MSHPKTFRTLLLALGLIACGRAEPGDRFSSNLGESYRAVDGGPNAPSGQDGARWIPDATVASDGSFWPDLSVATDANLSPPFDGGGAPFDDGAIASDGGHSSCSNGRVESGEWCDDGNQSFGDGCDEFCRSEWGYSCAGSPSMCSPWPLLGALDLGGTLIIERGPILPGSVDVFRFNLSSDALLSGELVTTTGDAELYIEHIYDLGFIHENRPGPEVFGSVPMFAGEHIVSIVPWAPSGVVASYRLELRADVNPAAGWTCPLEYFGSGDGCDCGCGRLDPDCASASATVCGACNAWGSCNDSRTCPGRIDPASNWTCLP